MATLLLALTTFALPAAAVTKRILFISSYHPAFSTFFDQVEGLKPGLAEAGHPAAEQRLDI